LNAKDFSADLLKNPYFSVMALIFLNFYYINKFKNFNDDFMSFSL